MPLFDVFQASDSGKITRSVAGFHQIQNERILALPRTFLQDPSTLQAIFRFFLIFILFTYWLVTVYKSLIIKLLENIYF